MNSYSISDLTIEIANKHNKQLENATKKMLEQYGFTADLSDELSVIELLLEMKQRGYSLVCHCNQDRGLSSDEYVLYHFSERLCSFKSIISHDLENNKITMEIVFSR